MTPTCPICGRATDMRWRPFCSRRCADVDLNRWLSGVYAVPVTEDSDEDGDATARRTDTADGDEAPAGARVIDFPARPRPRR
ncbi:MAG: DNA gyrase inhibitor YacG [Alphaproteobacteria bacterium]|nr:DNA gyrase inhibitor YacG [Alphaproteobacteria bacterium]